MLFNSVDFLLFFPLVCLLYYALKHQHRWILLLLASCCFYMAWKPEYILLILLSTIIDYSCGLKMGQTDDKKKRLPYLYLSLISNLGMLFLFKYFDFFTTSINTIFKTDLPLAQLILPMGISFYTFQTMSYSIDIYKGDLKPEKHFGKFSLFVTFFPQLVAGPIERASNLLPQFSETKTFDYDRVTSGLKQMLWGFFKKVIIADRLALLVNQVYNSPQDYDSGLLLLATFFFAFQIYCDFSGYSDIAIGAARVLGFDLMKNFDSPYFSKSVGEFWKRWHISLSTWFRDYVYIPLGGNRTVKWRWYYNLAITFIISGIWHGAEWTFLIWGALHAFYLITEISIKPIATKFWNWTKLPTNFQQCLSTATTFSLVCFAWVFFRANSTSDAYLILNSISKLEFKQLLDIIWSLKQYALNDPNISLTIPLKDTISGVEMGLNLGQFMLSIALIFFLLLLEFTKFDLSYSLKTKPRLIRWSVYILFIIACIVLGEFQQNEFIYFQF